MPSLLSRCRARKGSRTARLLLSEAGQGDLVVVSGDVPGDCGPCSLEPVAIPETSGLSADGRVAGMAKGRNSGPLLAPVVPWTPVRARSAQGSVQSPRAPRRSQLCTNASLCRAWSDSTNG